MGHPGTGLGLIQGLMLVIELLKLVGCVPIRVVEY